MTDTQQKVIKACREKACTSSELVEAFGVTRWYIYQLAKRGFLKNVGAHQGVAMYAASDEPPKPIDRSPKGPQWVEQKAIIQASSVWHYAERLK